MPVSQPTKMTDSSDSELVTQSLAGNRDATEVMALAVNHARRFLERGSLFWRADVRKQLGIFVGWPAVVRLSEGLPNGVQHSPVFQVQEGHTCRSARTSGVTHVKHLIHGRFLSDDHVPAQSVILNERGRRDLPPLQDSLIQRLVRLQLAGRSGTVRGWPSYILA